MRRIIGYVMHNSCHGAMEVEVVTELSSRPAVEANDPTALTREQQEKLNQHKVKTKIENELYLRNHPEISMLLSSFISDVLLQRPKDVPQFAAAYFTDPGLESKVKKHFQGDLQRTQ